jgi:predicted RNA-binding protein (virulence factor B family)
MQLANPFPGTQPLDILAITTDGDKIECGTVSYPFIDIGSDVCEMLVSWKGTSHKRAWTKAAGWTTVEVYMTSKERAAKELAAKELAEKQRKPEVKHENYTPSQPSK